ITNGSSAASIQWQSAPTAGGTWNDIDGANSMTYSVPTSTAGTMYFRARVIDNTSGCEDPNSNVVEIIVAQDPQISASVNNAEVCIGGSAVLTASLTGGSSAATLHWQSGVNPVSGPWTDISGATGTTYSVSTTSADTLYFKVRVDDPNNGCEEETSNAVTVIIRP